MREGASRYSDAVLIPEPQEVTSEAGIFRPGTALVIVLPENADSSHRFAAEELAASLKAEQKIQATIVAQAAADKPAIRLSRREGADLKAEGYRLIIRTDGITLEGNDAAGLFGGRRLFSRPLGRDAKRPVWWWRTGPTSPTALSTTTPNTIKAHTHTSRSLSGRWRATR